MRHALLIHRCWMKTFVLGKSPLYNWDGGGDWEGDDQECSALLFKHVGSKRIPNALIKAENKQEEEQYVKVNKRRQERLSPNESVVNLVALEG